MLKYTLRFISCTAVLVGGPTFPPAVRLPSATRLAIQPMTVVAGNRGYLADPCPVRLPLPESRQRQVFSGTTQAVAASAWPPQAQSFSWTPLTVDAQALQGAIAAAGARITNLQNLNIFQDDTRAWHAVLAVGVASGAHPDHWTVLVHARPSTPAPAGQTPRAWSADTVLAGSFAARADGNYDGKYFQDEGKLYLLYVKNLVPKPGLRNGIVLQPMHSFTQLAPAPPTLLLTPGDRDGELASERYAQTPARLVEAPYLLKVNGKYGLLYSTGAYEEPGYKAGIAWSDQLLPTGGRHYRKVLQPDPAGVWGEPGRRQVQYLVQSERPQWPNYTAGTVLSPGVPSALQGPGGRWYLYFAGFDPADRPLQATGAAVASHRRPYFVPLRVAVPGPEASVASATDASLVSWLQPLNE